MFHSSRAKPQGRYNILHHCHKTYQSVAKQFYRSWDNPKKNPPQVVRIINLTPPRYLVARYKKYRSVLEKRGRFSRQVGLRVGNERQRWLGTVPPTCKLFRKNVEPRGRCNDKYCLTCGVINKGLSIPRPSKYRFDRFGRGIYLTATSSKADDSTTTKHPMKGVRALLLCNVAIGRGKKLYKNKPWLRKPPRGYDSVLGEPSKGNGLKYDQLVIYNPAAVIPAFVVVYDAGKHGDRLPPQRRILFYHAHQPYYEFTNFSPHPVLYRGKVYPTSEHLFQCLKFLDHLPKLAEHIRTFSSKPRKIFDETHKFNSEVRKDWLRVRVDMKMDEALWNKFTQHKRLHALLLSTGEAELVENSPRDAFWGIGANGRGENQLGKALMRLRAKLQLPKMSPKEGPIPRGVKRGVGPSRDV